ncbi:DUF2767 family protein [Pantoea sp. DY-17]|uniref:DUF2767 family protein n=1 Tax=Pantoea sp. DY-17 TaxID=2871490 RepID=UPI001C9581AD|nr:DUF2767 family protein [Pantoea sp. DY-17]MBY4954534.1 DUF2767 family protein [Pantoea sp. DY-17]
MQVTQQQHADIVKVYTLIGAVVMAVANDGLETTRRRIAAFIREELARTDAWSPEMKTLMQSATETLEIYPAREVMGPHRDGDGGVH